MLILLILNLTMLCVVTVGRAVGWLFVRSIVAGVLQIVSFSGTSLVIWIVSSALVWGGVSLVALLPTWYADGQAQLWALVVVWCGGLMSGGLGAWHGNRKEVKRRPPEYQYVAGATVSGSLWGLLQVGLVITDLWPVREILTVFVVSLIAAQVIGVLLYRTVIAWTVKILGKWGLLRGLPALAWVLGSTIIWGLAGWALAGLLRGGQGSLGYTIISVVGSVLSGMCGGWAVSEFSPDSS